MHLVPLLHCHFVGNFMTGKAFFSPSCNLENDAAETYSIIITNPWASYLALSGIETPRHPCRKHPTPGMPHPAEETCWTAEKSWQHTEHHQHDTQHTTSNKVTCWTAGQSWHKNHHQHHGWQWHATSSDRLANRKILTTLSTSHPVQIHPNGKKQKNTDKNPIASI